MGLATITNNILVDSGILTANIPDSAFPSQTGNNGKYLTTDGSALSWATVSGSMAIGGSITSATAGSVLFAGTGGILSQDNSNLFFDDTNNRLCIGTNTSAGTLTVNGGAAAGVRITNGFLKASADTTFLSTSGLYHELISNTASTSAVFIRNSASTAPTGIAINYSNAAPNTTTSPFINCTDQIPTVRFQARSNGGLANFSANNVNLSDERVKKDITPLESYWEKFKSIEIVKFKYIDQTHDDFNIGVIAQQVESIAPEFVDVDGWGNENEDPNDPLKSIYTEDMHNATIKVLQEAMLKIEEQENRIKHLESLVINNTGN